MIDFGMTKELTDAERHTLARSLVAVVEDNEEEMLTLAHEAGLRSKHMRPETLVYFVRDIGRYREIWGDMGRYGESSTSSCGRSSRPSVYCSTALARPILPLDKASLPLSLRRSARSWLGLGVGLGLGLGLGAS